MIEETGWQWILGLAIAQVEAFTREPDRWIRQAREDVETVGILKEHLMQQLDLIERLYPSSVRRNPR